LKHRHIPIFALAAALFLTAQPQVTAFAEPATHRAEYRISFIGLPVARADFTAKVDGDNFTVDGQLSSAGVANIMSRTEGQTSVSGVRRGDQLQASTYLMSYTSGRKSSRTEVAFRDGSVVSAELTPEKKRTRPDWIPIADGDMRSVLDPVSGLMAPGGAKVCDRTLPIFDGETRFDVHLSQAGTQPFSTEGFAGEAIVCTARAEPKSGYHSEHSSTEALRETNVEVWFAKNDAADLYAPVYARVPTRMGAVTITATRFGS
jgi:hypothetical protein